MYEPTPSAALRSPLLSSSPPPISVAGNVAAGIYSGLATFLDCAAFTSVVFASAGLPLTVGLQHALVGFVVTQLVVSRLSNIGYLLVPISYEMMPFLSHFVSAATAAGASGASLLATLLAASVIVGLLGAVLVGIVAEMPVKNVEALLPPALQAGLFGAIGWSIYVLAFETLHLPVATLEDAQSLIEWSSVRLWLPANVLGVGLWLAVRWVDSPLLFPCFILGVSLLVHGVRLLTGTSLADARSGGWLMDEAPVAPATQLWRAFAPSLVRWDVIRSPAGLVPILCATLFGPVVNTVLNFILCGPLFKTKLDMRKELRAHAIGALCASCAGGYSSYIALSNTAIHRKVGGTVALSTNVAATVGLAFLIAYPLGGSVGFVPTLVIAAICVYIGVDFLFDNVVEPLRAALRASSSSASSSACARLGPVVASWAVLALCVQRDMLLGTAVGILGFQLAKRLRWWGD